MAAFIKHVGRHEGTGQRLSTVFMQLPDDKEHALVVYSDSLPDRYHDAYMEAIESAEGQSTSNLYEVLTRKVFWHGKTMLDTLHTEGHLKKVPTSSIIMTPNSNTNVRLTEILEQIEQINSGKTVEEKPVVSNKSQVDTNVSESQKDESRAIAQNLLTQARLLEQDAIAKREEAYKYDPSLRPSKSSEKPVASDSTKKRGRPKKTE